MTAEWRIHRPFPCFCVAPAILPAVVLGQSDLVVVFDTAVLSF